MGRRWLETPGSGQDKGKETETSPRDFILGAVNSKKKLLHFNNFFESFWASLGHDPVLDCRVHANVGSPSPLRREEHCLSLMSLRPYG